MDFRTVDAPLPKLRRDAPTVHHIEAQALEKARAQRQCAHLFEAARQRQVKQLTHQPPAQAVAMLTGILVGTYSSIFNASPILYLWDLASIKRKGPAGGLMAEAEREIKLRATQVAAAGGMGMAPGETPAGYGTVKRRSSVADQATRPVDED